MNGRKRRRALQIIGAFLILCSALLVAQRMLSEVEISLERACALREVLEHIKNMIECYSLPIGQILERLDPSVLRGCGYFGENAPRDLFELVEKSEILDKETLDIFSAFAKEFGKGYRQDELLRCGAFLDRMRVREQKIGKELAKKKRVIPTVAVCSALAVIILLV